MGTLQNALSLAELGFFVFPLGHNSKLPIQKGPYRSYATRDLKRIRQQWICPILGTEKDYNVGISTDKFGDKGEALFVIDIDVDKEKGIDGFKKLKELKNAGLKLPNTYWQQSPRGGFHFFYRVEKAVTQGAGDIGLGIDTRSAGGLVVGVGSSIDGKKYTANGIPVARCPKQILKLYYESKAKTQTSSEPKTQAPENKSAHRDIPWPTATEGNRAATSYKLACQYKDHGFILLDTVNELLYWNADRCLPPLSKEEIIHQCESAYRYGTRELGSALPENHFDAIDEGDIPENKIPENKIPEDKIPKDTDPILKLNKEFAYVIEGGSGTILRERKSEKGEINLERIKPHSFFEYFSNQTVPNGVTGRLIPLAKAWMSHSERRTYDKVVFKPGLKTPPSQYNLWKGYSVSPLEKGETPSPHMVEALNAFEEHLFENVCSKDEFQKHWLLSFFAHLIQKPYEKPLVAPVFCGPKGVGKDSLIDRVGALIAKHYVMAADTRLLVSNFNAHLEHCLLMVLNEAFWSGDKRAEGILKNLITGDRHVIERKGKELTTARNYTRVVIIGNERWLVPATYDERRFAVFNIGTKRMQDGAFFHKMRRDMERGGYRYLLRILLDYDIKKINLNQAPKTKALLQQKIEGLDPLNEWWLSCLDTGTVTGLVFSNGVWPKEVGCEELRDAYYKEARARGIRSRLQDSRQFGRDLRKVVVMERHRKKTDGSCVWQYKFPPLKKCRKMWEKVMGGGYEWQKDDMEEVGL